MKNFSLDRHFIFIFAIMISASTFAFDLMLSFHEIPASNKDIVNMIAGVLNTSCLVTVVAFFFSSTQASREKNKMLLDAKKEEPTNEQKQII